MTLIIILIVAIWLWSYIKFRHNYKMDRVLCEMLGYKYSELKTPEAQMEYACGLMLCQQYADALVVFQDLEQKGYQRQFDFLPENISFCKKPLPWSSGDAKNHNGSWWHNFLLVRFGRRRKVAISRDSYLEASALLRHMERMKRG